MSNQPARKHILFNASRNKIVGVMSIINNFGYGLENLNIFQEFSLIFRLSKVNCCRLLLQQSHRGSVPALMIKVIIILDKKHFEYNLYNCCN